MCTYAQIVILLHLGFWDLYVLFSFVLWLIINSTTGDFIARVRIYYIWRKGFELEMDGLSIRR
jgi:hypothetical protein